MKLLPVSPNSRKGWWQISAALASLTEGALTLVENTSPADGGGLGGLPSLASKVRGSRAQSLLGGVFCAEDLPSALAARHQLGGGQSIVTRDGIWLGPAWLRVVRLADEQRGVIQRQQDIDTLQAQVLEADEAIAALEQQRQL